MKPDIWLKMRTCLLYRFTIGLGARTRFFSGLTLLEWHSDTQFKLHKAQFMDDPYEYDSKNYWLIWWNDDMRMGSLKSDSFDRDILSVVPSGREAVVMTEPPLVINDAALPENATEEDAEICFESALVPGTGESFSALSEGSNIRSSRCISETWQHPHWLWRNGINPHGRWRFSSSQLLYG